MGETISQNIPTIAFLVIYAAVLLKAFSVAYNRRTRPVDLESTPILLGYYTEGSELIPAMQGKLGDLEYSAIGIVGSMGGGTTGGSALLYRIELPFITKVHLLAIPKQSGATQLNPAKRGGLMEKVVLEGDYQKYFTLFCEKGMQADARYVLDPAAMQYTIEFSQSHNWEITGNELYFVQASGTGSMADPTPMQQDIESFVNEIRPAIGKKLPKQIASSGSKSVVYVGETYKCPICTAPMSDESNYYLCPRRHGIFLMGYRLPLVKSGAISNPPSLANQSAEHGILNCPACGNKMERVPYTGSKTIIDSCTKCPYRWLDAGELAQLRKKIA